MDALVHSLDELWLRRIVQNQQGDNYNFTHGKLRDAAYEALSNARRRLNHRRISDALISNSREESGVTARHFELAGQYDRAIEWYIKAAQASRQVFANQVAKSYLEQALSLIPENQEWDEERTRKAIEIRETLGDIPVYAEASDRYLWETKIRKLAEAPKPTKTDMERAFDPPDWKTHFNTVLSLT